MIERLAAAHRAGELPRLHARVRRLAQDADDAHHLLSPQRYVRPARLSPRPVPKTRGQTPRDLVCCLFQRLSVITPCPSGGVPLFDGGALRGSDKSATCRQFSMSAGSTCDLTREPLLDREGLDISQNMAFCRYLSPLPDSNRGPPPYHGGFALLLCDLGRALSSALSLQPGWFLRSLHPCLEGS
jgi:hypothetical protein